MHVCRQQAWALAWGGCAKYFIYASFCHVGLVPLGVPGIVLLVEFRRLTRKRSVWIYEGTLIGCNGLVDADWPNSGGT